MSSQVQASPNTEDWGFHGSWEGGSNDPADNRLNLFTDEGLYIEIINEQGYSGVQLNNQQRLDLISALLVSVDDLPESYFNWPAEIPDGVFEDEDGWL